MIDHYNELRRISGLHIYTPYSNEEPDSSQQNEDISDELASLRTLAGIGKGNKYSNYTGVAIPSSAEKRAYEKEHNIQPGTDEWFRLHFSRPTLTGVSPF